MSMKKEYKLYRFYWDCGALGDVEGVFVATPEQIEQALGKYLYLGEVEGEDCQIGGYLEASDLEQLNVSLGCVIELRNVLGSTISGINPLHYVIEEEDLNEPTH